MTPPSSSADPVVVVGAGLAGLHAAWRLHLAGIDVVVLEARDRVGGRTWSLELPDGTVVERGGEFIAPGDGALRALCAELGLDLVPHGFPFERRPTLVGPAPTPTEVAAVLEQAQARVDALDAGADAPADAVLTPQAERGAVETAVAARIETSLTIPLRRASARRVFGEGAGEHGYDPSDHVRGGNQSIALELARRLDQRVRLTTPVIGVHHDNAGAAVRCSDGVVVRAGAVVLAVPLPVLLDLDLDPGLPAPLVAAAGRALFGDAAKLHVPLTEAPRVDRVASATARWWCWTSRASTGSLGAPVLSGFAGGEAAILALGAAHGSQTWAAEALALRPDATAWGAPLVTHWGAEPWTRGSYSCHGIGADHADDAAWRTPFGAVVLAGEHTAGDASGTMNGAVASGVRAASTVMDLLQGQAERLD